MKLKILLSMLGFALAINVSAQTSLSGKVTDADSGEPVLFGNVKLFQNGVYQTGRQTDFDGNYSISPLDPGTYDVEVSYVGYAPQRIEGIEVLADKDNHLNVQMFSGVELQEIIIIDYKVPLIEKDNTVTGYSVTSSEVTKIGSRPSKKGKRKKRRAEKENIQSGGELTGEQIQQLPSKSINGIVANVAGTVSTDPGEDVTIKGGQADVAVYSQDGVKVEGDISTEKAETITPVVEESSEKDPEQISGDEYSAVPENEFIYPLEEAVSTFSIDVDHASYSNVRRYISNNQLPPAEAVRVEEMINYFDYDYAQPNWPEPFSIYTESGPCPWNPEAQLLHIGLQGIDVDFEQAPPNNLVFLVDVSGSMSSPNKLPLVQESLGFLIDRLRPEDKVSIVTYAGAPGLVLEPTSCANKDAILEAIARMCSGGSTAGGAGIELAYEVALEQYFPEGNNRVILATDGDFNVGLSSEGGLEKLIEDKRQDGIFLTVLGFGYGNYKDNKLEILADKGNGNYAYIDQANEAKKVFVQEITGTLLTIAKDVKIQVEFDASRVESYRLVGYENRLLEEEDFEDDTKDAGELGSGHTVTAIYELILKAGAPAGDLAELRLRYKRPKEDVSSLITQAVVANTKPLDACSDDYLFSAAVAAFGMLLRHSKYRGYLTARQVVELAEGAQGADTFGYRTEFIELVRRADEMSLLGSR